MVIHMCLFLGRSFGGGSFRVFMYGRLLYGAFLLDIFDLMICRVSRYWTIQWKLLLSEHGVHWVMLGRGVRGWSVGMVFLFLYLRRLRRAIYRINYKYKLNVP